MTSLEDLRKLEEEVRANTGLPLIPANLVFGEGDPGAEVMFVGEAPGEREDQLGRPFVGRAGQLLDRLIASLGWRREGVYITNIVKRRPPDNRDPLPEEISAYAPYLSRQITIISPLVIVTLGRFSMAHFLPTGKITRDQGKIFKIQNRFIYPLFHPAAALRSPQVLTALENSFLRLPLVLERCRTARKETDFSPPEEKQRGLF